MNKDTNVYFTEIPSANIERTILDISRNIRTTANFSRLIPFYHAEVLPGDTFKVSTSIVCRLQTLLAPVCDDAYIDIAYFFCPNRILWTHWQEFMGENTQSAWLDPATYSLPLLSYPTGGFAKGTIADYFGIPTGVDPTGDENKPHVLPFRAYAMICNEFWRDQNLTDPLNIPTGDSNQTGTNGDSYINDVANGGMPFKVAKFHDFFTSMLPSPQRGAAVSLNLIDSGSQYLPVDSGKPRFVGTYSQPDPIYNNQPIEFVKLGDRGVTSQTNYAIGATGSGNAINQTSTTTSTVALVPSNLWADASGMMSSITVNELRLAFQLQKYYERLGYAGSRYREQLQAFFGVTSPDSRMMIPEYLGGHRIPLTIHQIANQAESATSNLGDLGAMSNTSDMQEYFTKSFVEHGYVIGVLCLRTNRSYSQGLERHWSRRTREEYFNPVFAHLGNQPHFKRELFLDDTNTTNNDVFGYQEAWAEYRYAPSLNTGEMRPGIANSLAHWHFGDYYTTAPTLSDAWIREDMSVVDRALAVTSSTADQAFMDIYVQNIATRPVPMYSIPGLIDHF
jgi:hypothetical protein